MPASDLSGLVSVERDLVSIVLGLVRSLDRNAEIIGLLFR